MDRIPNTTLAWRAGLIDGEGSVMLIRRKGGMIKRMRNPHFRAVVSISNTDLRLMRALAERTGIDRVYKHVRPLKENHKAESYTWRMVASEIRVWGPKLLPWLVLKREQMGLLLEALAIAEANTPRK